MYGIADVVSRSSLPVQETGTTGYERVHAGMLESLKNLEDLKKSRAGRKRHPIGPT
jgi:hypothetical protein